MHENKRKSVKILETDTHDYNLVDTDHKKFMFKGQEVNFDIYQKPAFLDQLIEQGFEYLERKERPKTQTETKAVKA